MILFFRYLTFLRDKSPFSLQMIFNYLFFFGICLSLLSITNGQFNKDHLTKLEALECDEPSITLHVFSGTSNPVWKINTKQLATIKKFAYETLYHSDNLALLSKPTTRIMGYQGFTISCSSDEYVFINGLSPLEHLILIGGRRYLSSSVMRHVKDHVGEIMSDITDIKPSKAECNKVPIRGPDTVPVYDPKSDDDGCFIARQTENNCYAYGNKISRATKKKL
jgi:hypothetical protein